MTRRTRRRRRTRQEEAEEEEEQEEEATDIKSNNPHLAGGEISNHHTYKMGGSIVIGIPQWLVSTGKSHENRMKMGYPHDKHGHFRRFGSEKHLDPRKWNEALGIPRLKWSLVISQDEYRNVSSKFGPKIHLSVHSAISYYFPIFDNPQKPWKM